MIDGVLFDDLDDVIADLERELAELRRCGSSPVLIVTWQGRIDEMKRVRDARCAGMKFLAAA
jgi:hypothetical protein